MPAFNGVHPDFTVDITTSFKPEFNIKLRRKVKTKYRKRNAAKQAKYNKPDLICNNAVHTMDSYYLSNVTNIELNN
jgi:hypothetical protein